MKKSTLLIIAVVYLASIVIVSVMGMRAVIFAPVVPVEKILLTKSDFQDNLTYITDYQKDENGENLEIIKRIEINFTTPGTIDANGNAKGTFVQLFWRVLPSDVKTNSRVVFDYGNTNRTDVEFVKDADGNHLGLLLIKSKAWINITLRSVDGSGVYTTVTVWAK